MASDDKDDSLMENEREMDDEMYMEMEEEQEKRKKLKPQEELLESWYITLDDRVESLTNHLRSLKNKRTHVVGALSAFVKYLKSKLFNVVRPVTVLLFLHVSNQILHRACKCLTNATSRMHIQEFIFINITSIEG